MHDNRKVLPVRVLKVWFDIVLILGGLAAAIFVVWLALAPFVMLQGGIPAEATVRVAVGDRSWFPVYPVELATAAPDEAVEIESARLVSGIGDLRLVTHDWTLHFAYLAGVLVATAVILYGIWALRRVLVNVLADRPFAAANGQLLRRCGYLILALGALYPPFDFLLARSALAKIDITNLALRPAITFDKDVFVVGLLFLVFGLILDHGRRVQRHEKELEAEQALTI